MTKKEQIENVARVIANRVRYHAPVVYDGDIDVEELEKFGIDATLPIFKFEKHMTKPLMKAFSLAKKIVNFNLVVTEKTNCPFALFLPTESVNLRLVQMVNKLNINYKAISNYNPKFEVDYLKINGESLNLIFNDFVLERHKSIDGVLVTERRFVCSGECIILELCNSNSKQVEVVVDFNKNLRQGNYFFKKERSSLKIQDLFSIETCFLNTNFNLNNVFFSCIDGVENSCYARVKFNQKITLKPFQKKCFFINFGDKCFSVRSQDDMEDLLKLSKKMCYENFNVKIFTTNKKIDENFNTILPRNIWINWLNGKRDLSLEKEYVQEKEKIVLKEKDRVVFSAADYKGYREIDIFDGKEFRSVFINNFSNENALLIGNARFQNLKSFCLDKIKPKTQICLHFK